MDEEIKKKQTFESPTYLSRTIAIVGLVIGILSCIGGVSFLIILAVYPELASLCIPLSIVYGLGGLALLVLGIYGCVTSVREKEKAARTSYLIGFGWCILSAAVNLVIGIVGSVGISDGWMYLLPCLFAAIAFISAAVLLLLTSIRIKNSKPFKGIGMAGSICFIVCVGANFFSLFILGQNSGFAYLINAALVLVSIFLLVISVQGKYVSEEEAKAEEAHGELPPSGIVRPASHGEEERIRLLKAYKDLLDSGAITQEDYEKKKKDILGE